MTMNWCGGGDLNPYARRRQILSLVRLPFRHLRYGTSVVPLAGDNDTAALSEAAGRLRVL